MKTLRHYLILLSISIISSLLINCEKVDTKMELLDDPTSELNASALKATPTDATNEIDYLLGLIETIESLLEDGELSKGNANALIVKIENAIKSIEKGNTNAVTGQLGAFTSQVEAFVESGVIDEDIGEDLVNIAETGIILAEGSFIDPRDEQEYAVILIGDQLWMAENLKFLPEVSPPYLGSYEEPYYYVYGYEGTSVSEAKTTENYNTYGVLYNWSASREAAPDGWHLPSMMEWHALVTRLGGGSVAGGKVKEEGYEHWLHPNTGATDEVGFTALPAGHRSMYLNFNWIGRSTDWHMTSTYQYLPTTMCIIGPESTYASFSMFCALEKEWGISIRCIKD